jgi:hypothetical protein
MSNEMPVIPANNLVHESLEKGPQEEEEKN